MEEALWFWAASSNENFFLTEDVVIALFDKLVVPLEDANSLWCLPAFLLNRRERPPANWEFLTNTIPVLFALASSASFPKKRRTGGGGGGDHGEPLPIMIATPKAPPAPRTSW